MSAQKYVYAVRETVLALIIVILMIGLSSDARALDCDYLGSLEQGLHAPSDVVTFPGGLAVLEPFAEQLTVYTPDGLLSYRTHLQSGAHGLTAIEPNRFLFCDLARRVVVSLNTADQRLEDFLTSASGVGHPVDLDFSGGMVYVLDAAQSALLSFDTNGSPRRTISLLDEDGEPLEFAASFDIDRASGRICVLDQVRSSVLLYSLEGKFLRALSNFGTAPGETSRGGDVAWGLNGHLLIADRYQGRVSIYTADYAFAGYLTDDDAAEISMYLPIGLTVDPSGVVYVTSSMTPAVLMYYVDFDSSTAEMMRAEPQLPHNGAELIDPEIQLVARARQLEFGPRLTGFLFEIFGDGENPGPMLTSDLVPFEVTDTTGENSIITARWSFAVPLKEGKYQWRSRLAGEDFDGPWSDLQAFSVVNLPGQFQLHQNYPNPFNPKTHIQFALAVDAKVTLEVFNLLGQRVATLSDRFLEAGEHKVTWDGTDNSGAVAASGVYFYRLSTSDFEATRKMVLVR